MRLSAAIVSLSLASAAATAQPANWSFAATVSGGITTAARLMTRPDAANPDERSASDAYNGMWSVGGSLRVPIVDGEFFLSLSTEYAKSVRTQLRPYGTPVGIRLVAVDEGIEFLPFEAGLHAIIPLGSDRFQATICGGGGVYVASRTLRIAGVSSSSVEISPDVNIYVGLTMGYRFAPGLMIESGLLFRDPDVSCSNRFPSGSIDVDGVSAPLPAVPLPSSIIVDGMRFSVGFVWELR